MRIKETNVSEPLKKCRKPADDVKTRGNLILWEESGRDLHTVQVVSGMKGA